MKKVVTKKKVLNPKLLEKLAQRGETLEEREERRSKRRHERIAATFGYTNDDNPFNDTNLHETFTWKKRNDKVGSKQSAADGTKDERTKTAIDEINKVRARRQEREDAFDERERLKAEESRMREMQNYDEWQKKEEEFHLQQQRQRSAIRLVQGREKPIDVLAKNLLLFGLTEMESQVRRSEKYQERYNALDDLSNLEAELAEPHVFLRDLKLNELEELLSDVHECYQLEKESQSQEDDNMTFLDYWSDLLVVIRDEIKYLNTGGIGGTHEMVAKDIYKMFENQTTAAISALKKEIESKIRNGGAGVDTDYWYSVLEQLDVYQAKASLSEIHSTMLLRQLDKLEKRRAELGSQQHLKQKENEKKPSADDDDETEQKVDSLSSVKFPEGNLDEALGLSDEVDLGANSYRWQEKYRPRKPRYFNRVRTGYDWNKYNQTHYDHDNPPPKTVQGYKFNIFYPDLVDKSRTPQYFLEPADSNEFCIIRFSAGAPYEDVAFKIINREWNKSRKRGFKCVFERGVLSLFFNFNTHWYRR